MSPFDAAYQTQQPSAFGAPAETPEERQQRIRQERLTAYNERMATPKPPLDRASPEVSPPIVPNSSVQPQPYSRPKPTTHTNTTAFATEPEAAYPGVSATLSLARDAPLQRDVPADAAAAIQSRVAQHEASVGGIPAAQGLGPRDAPPQYPAAPAGIPEEEDGYFERLGRGLLSKGGDLTSGFAQVLSDTTQTAAMGMGENQAGAAMQGLSDFFMSSTEWLDDIQSESYEPKYDDVAHGLEEARQGHFGYLLGFIAEQAPLTLADALVSLAGMPLYLTATTGDFAAERAGNDGRSREELTPEDYAYGSAAAAVSFVLDKILLGQGGKIASNLLGKETVKQLADFGSSSTMKRVLSSGFRGAATEMVEEGAQQGLTTVDTEKGATVEDIALAAVGGALAGGPAAAGFDLFAGHPSQRGAIPDPEQDVAADARAAIEAAAGEKPMQGPPAPEMPPMQGPQQPPMQGPPAPEAPPMQGPPAPEAPPMQGPPAPEMPPMQGPQQPPMQGPPAPEAPPMQGPIRERGPVQGPPAPTFVPPAGAQPAIPEAAQAPAPLAPGSMSIDEEQQALEEPEDVVSLPSGDVYRPQAIPEKEVEAPALSASEEPTEEDEVEERRVARKLDRERKEQLALASRHIHANPKNAGASMLRDLSGAVPDSKVAASNRDLLTTFYDTLHRYALTLAGRAEVIPQQTRAKAQNLADLAFADALDKESRTLIPRFYDTAVSFALARSKLMELSSSGNLTRGREGKKSALEQVYENLYIDPTILSTLGLDRELVAKAASGDDQAALLDAIRTIGRKAHGKIQKYQAEVGELPSLPDAGKRDKLSRKEKLAKEAVREMETPPAPLKKAKGHIGDAKSLATSRSLYTDQRKRIRDPETGQMVDNPDYGRVLKVKDEAAAREQSRERAELEAEETAYEERLGWDPERAPVTLKNPVARRGPVTAQDVFKATQSVDRAEANLEAAQARQAEAEDAFIKAGGTLTPRRDPDQVKAAIDRAVEKVFGVEGDPEKPGALALFDQGAAEARAETEQILESIRSAEGMSEPDFAVIAEDVEESMARTEALAAERRNTTLRRLNWAIEDASDPNLGAIEPPMSVARAVAALSAARSGTRVSTIVGTVRREQAQAASAVASDVDAAFARYDATEHHYEAVRKRNHRRIAELEEDPWPALSVTPTIRTLSEEPEGSKRPTRITSLFGIGAPPSIEVLRAEILQAREARDLALHRAEVLQELAKKPDPKDLATRVVELKALAALEVKQAARDLAIAKAWNKVEAARKATSQVITQLEDATRRATPLLMAHTAPITITLGKGPVTLPPTMLTIGKPSAKTAGLTEVRGAKLERRRAETIETALTFYQAKVQEAEEIVVRNALFADEWEEAFRRDSRAAAEVNVEVQTEVEKRQKKAEKEAEKQEPTDDASAAKKAADVASAKAKKEAKKTGKPAVIPAWLKARRDAKNHLDWYVHDAELPEGQRPEGSNLPRIRALAHAVWTGRKYRPKEKYVRVVNPLYDEFDAEEASLPKFERQEQFVKVYGAIPRVKDRSDLKEGEGTRARYKPRRYTDKKTGTTVFAYGSKVVGMKPDGSPDRVFEVEAAEGIRFGEAMRDATTLRYLPLTRLFPKNQNMFDPLLVDDLLAEIAAQNIGQDAAMDRIIASILIERASKQNFTNVSGTRGYEGATRAPRRERPGKGPERQPRKERKPKAVEPKEEPPKEEPQETEDQLDQLDPEEKKALEEEGSQISKEDFLQQVADLVKKAVAGGAPTPEEKRRAVAYFVSLHKKKEDLDAEILTAVDMLPTMLKEVSTQQPDPETRKLTYLAPDGWPPAANGWPSQWSAQAKGDTVVIPYRRIEPYQGTDDTVFHKVITDQITITVDRRKKDSEDLARRIENDQKAWTTGGGGTLSLPGRRRKRAIDESFVRPTRPIDVDADQPGVPGDDDVGLPEGKRTTQRSAVNIYSNIDALPVRDDPFVARFGPIRDARTGLVIPGKRVDTSQKTSANQILQKFHEREEFLSYGQPLDTVNSAGVMLASGPGAGKSIVIAMSADSIYESQRSKEKLPVLIVARPNLMRALKDSFREMGLNPEDTSRYRFIPYNDLASVKNPYAAAIFDESQWIKSPKESRVNAQGVEVAKEYGPAARKLDVPFRLFATATPVDQPMQEEYYMRYLLTDASDPPLSVQKATDIVKLRLGTSGDDPTALEQRWKKNKRAEENYVRELDKMTRDAARRNAMINWSLVPNMVTKAPAIVADPEAEAAAAHPENQNAATQTRLNEHMKLPAMVAATVERLKPTADGREWGVIGVFQLSNRPDKDSTKVRGDEAWKKFNVPAILRMREMLIEAGVPKEQIAVLKGGEDKMIDIATGKAMDAGEIARRFREGEYRVLLMVDVVGGTGLSLDDQSEGGMKPKLMMIAGVSGIGQEWLQLQGRPDRKNTTSEPHAWYMLLPDSKTDQALRKRIRTKLNYQRASSGAFTATEDPTHPYSSEHMLDQLLRKQAPGAAPLHSSPVDSMVSERLSNGPVTASSLVADIARNQTDPALAELAGALVGHLGLAGIQVSPTVADAGVLGYAQGRGAYVNVGSGSEAITALHEIFHHLSHWAIDNHPGYRARLLQIMKAVPPELAPMFEGVLTNPHEFATTAHTDPAFRAALKKIKGPSGVTLWQRFKEWVQVVLGLRSRNFSALDAVLELKLADPGTVTEHGSGDVSQQLATAMYRQRMMPAQVAELADRASDTSEWVFGKTLAGMTFGQIVDSFSRHSVDENGANLLKRLEDIREQQAAATNLENHRYIKEVVEPLQDWATRFGNKLIKVRLTPTGPVESIPAMQFLAEVMNASGYATLHFGKAAGDPENAMIHPPTGKKPSTRGRDRSHVYWDLFKPQFDKLGPEGVQLYNNLAAYFAEQADQVSILQTANFLDQVSPRPDGLKWVAHPKEVRAKMRSLKKLTPAELKEANLTTTSLEELHAILETGIVKGAYFPLKRFGDNVVVIKHKAKYETEEEKQALLNRYLGARVDTSKMEVNYKSVSRFETQTHARSFMERMKRELPDAEIRGPLLSSSTSVIEHAGLSHGLIQQFAARINAQAIPEKEKRAQINIFTQAMIDLMPEASYADTFRPRKGEVGASTDIMRSLSSYGAAFSHYKGATLFAAQYRDATGDLLGRVHQLEGSNSTVGKSRKLRTISNELATRSEIMSTAFTEQRWAQTANNIGFGYMLVGASYNVLNMSQPVLVTTPYLAGEFGLTSTTAAMARAYSITGGAPMRRLARSGFTLGSLKGMVTGKSFDRKNYDVLTEMVNTLRKSGDNRHAKLLENLSVRNKIDATVAMDMAQGARQAQVDPKTGAPIPQGKLAYLTEWMRMAPHITEVMNRAVTAVASFDLEYARLKKQGKLTDAQAFQAAEDYAAKAIDATQFNYQNWNKPRIIQGSGVMRTLLMFKQHPQNIYFFMISRAIKSSSALSKHVRGQKLTADEAKEAKVAAKQLAYFIGFHVLAAGAIGGTPEPIKWLIGMLAALFGDDDEPFNYELFMQNSMTDWMGPELGNVAARGLPNLAGVDLSSRIGIDSMLMFEGPDTTSADSFMSDIFRIAGGPMVTLAAERPYQAYAALRNGDYTQMVEAVTPKAIRDPIRAWRVGNEGFTTYAGRVYSESDQVGTLEMFLTSLGFAPSSTSLMYLSREVDSQVDVMTAKRTRLMERAYFARTDPAAWNDSISELRRWNRDNRAFQISMGDLVKSMKNRKRNQDKTHGGMLVPKKYQPWADYQNRFRGIEPAVTHG